MRQASKFRKPAPWMGALLALAAALALAACDSNIDITGPDFPDIQGVWVNATLASTSEGGSLLEARLLFDGRHIARNNCDNAAGNSCAVMNLTGFATRTAGRHTLELQVLRQSPAEVVYRADVELRSSRSGSPFQRLGPTSEALREGESVTFEIDIR